MPSCRIRKYSPPCPATHYKNPDTGCCKKRPVRGRSPRRGGSAGLKPCKPNQLRKSVSPRRCVNRDSEAGLKERARRGESPKRKPSPKPRKRQSPPKRKQKRPSPPRRPSPPPSEYSSWDSQQSETEPDYESFFESEYEDDTRVQKECIDLMCKNNIHNKKEYLRWAVAGGHPDKGGNTAIFQGVNTCQEHNYYCNK